MLTEKKEDINEQSHIICFLFVKFFGCILSKCRLNQSQI